MAKKLVIVESPAKAKTIGSYLGNDYVVEASIGHVRDLPPNSKSLPAEHRKKWWADYAVDVDAGFEPFYEVPSEKASQVSKLKAALKGKEELILATDEDREGESISWHLLEILNPPKSVKVKRIAFHEITREAIQHALDNPRDIDEKLVDAQETRRILDRLYGYTLSPVLWSRVTKNLSAGRVQSPAVKLIVAREEARRRFRSASYWDLKAGLASKGEDFSAMLKQVAGKSVASGDDFDDTTGELKPNKADKVMLLNQAAAEALVETAKVAKPWTVSNVETKEGQERPAPPFMTTTLQQDANRKFGFAADRTMRIAQSLYEGVNINGEQVGLITYMRTDSLTLSKASLSSIRDLISREYKDCLPNKPTNYSSKVRNAQEAHEAIRPTDPFRKPSSVESFLNADQMKIYDLIWKRTVASQMLPARVLKTEVTITVKAGDEELLFGSSGKQILFDGFRRVYTEGRDEVDSDKDGDRTLPRLEKGMELDLTALEALGHETKPPARYTDATLIKKLEDQGIGRPSTYASIISVILDRGYARKSGKQLIPTFKAYLAMEVLEQNFEEFMELDFTARMDDVLDDISQGKADPKQYLTEFFIGDDKSVGLKRAVDERKKEIPYPNFKIGEHPETGETIIVRSGRDGSAFLQFGDSEQKKYANVPDDLAPADLTVEKAIELLNQKKQEAQSIGEDPATGRRLLLKQRNGYYLEVERTPEEIEKKEKPRWISLPTGDPNQFTQEELNFICSLPTTIGNHPENGEPILFKIGKYGAYLEWGSERRTVEDWRSAQNMSVEQAVEILSQPKYKSARAAAGPIKELGKAEGFEGEIKVMSGRFGPYVTDGEINATLPKTIEPESVTLEQATELLVKKREAGPSTRRRFSRRGSGSKKASARKK